eukprot:scaffold87878_cov14-Tisochrysis_lutea.AAC.1
MQAHCASLTCIAACKRAVALVSVDFLLAGLCAQDARTGVLQEKNKSGRLCGTVLIPVGLMICPGWLLCRALLRLATGSLPGPYQLFCIITH